MTKLKASIIMVALATVLTTVTAFAASYYRSPAEAAAGLTGRTLESVIEEKIQTEKTYGAIAKEAGKLDEFKDEMLNMRRELLEKKVADGIIAREQAEEILAEMEQNQVFCDGTQQRKCGQRTQNGFGKYNGGGQGLRKGNGNGSGSGQGRGNGAG